MTSAVTFGADRVAAPLFQAPHHPVVVCASSGTAGRADFIAEATERRRELQDLLTGHGAVLFRGYGLRGAADFEAAVASLGGQAFGYVGGNSPRTRVLHDVFTATDYPACEVISLHNELSYMHSWPRRLFFFCEQPALTGGQTSLAHGGDVLRTMPPEIVAELQARKVRYVRTFNPRTRIGKSWQATYDTEDRDELSAILQAQGSMAQWSADGVLRVSTTCEAVITHPVSAETVWFNQAEQWHPSALPAPLRQLLRAQGQLAHQCEFGDGSPMDDETLAEIRRVINRQKLLFDWRAGDLLMVDNLAMLHGREAFTGTRKTFAYLSSS